MQAPIHPRDRRSGTVDSVPRALLFAVAMMIGCGLATAASAADDKAKASVETPSKAIVESQSKAVAEPTVTITPPTPATAPDAAEAKTDSTTGKTSPRRRGHIQFGDDEFDTFSAGKHVAGWVIGMAFLVAITILLTPIILLIGIIWYKLRKTRLQNEVVLELAAKGAMAPAQAVDAVMSGVTSEVAEASASARLAASSAAPVYQQAVISRRRAVWSDLRKGVILTAIGLSFVFYSMVESSSANWIGLVLMFLGLGYILLWWFEDRHLQRRETSAEVGTDVGKS